MTDSPKLLRRLMKVLKGEDIAERDRLTAEIDRLTGHVHKLARQRDELLAQRDEFLAQRDQLTAQRGELTAQRDELTAQRDELTAQRDARKAEIELQTLTNEITSSSIDRMKPEISKLLDGRRVGSKTFSLDLMEAMLTGAIFEDPPLPTFGEKGYDANVRERGLDWPSHAYSMIGAERMRNFRTLIENVIKAKIPGDIVETGVWRGGASMMARAVLKAHDVRDRKVILADSFEGLPPPDESHFPADAGSTFHQFPDLAVSLEQVQENFKQFGLLDEQVMFAKGWFKDTMPTLPTQKIAILRLDGDMYESTIQPLEHLYDRISPGGWIIVDDYDVIPACKAAVTDFLAKRGLNPTIVPIDGVGVYFQKEPVGTGSQTQH